MNKETRRFIAYGLLSLLFLILTFRTAFRMESQKGLLHWDTIVLIFDLWMFFRYTNRLSKTLE